MTEVHTPIGLFEAFGIEIELMIVDRDSLDVRPWADRLLKKAAGRLVSDFNDGEITWSNELVLHVIEFKTSAPSPTLENLELAFFKSQRRADDLLRPMGARLMPTGMHPWMNPLKDTHLWPHDNNEIYALYDTIFDCRGHGWSNLQSVHINLPFKNEDEFRRLHSAARIVLPLIPALSASSPIVDSHLSATKDTRLAFYEINQKRLPIIAGDVVPDAVEGFDDYRQKITNPIRDAVAPFDAEGLLCGDWLNSRGAIARIDRQTIEIRLLDTQECARADLTLVRLIVKLIESLANDAVFLARADALATKTLHELYSAAVKDAEAALISDQSYLALFGVKAPLTANELWKQLFYRGLETIDSRGTSLAADTLQAFDELLCRPSLASRIASACGPQPSRHRIFQVYQTLCDCLDQNRIFESSLLPVSFETNLEQPWLNQEPRDLRRPNSF